MISFFSEPEWNLKKMKTLDDSGDGLARIIMGDSFIIIPKVNHPLSYIYIYSISQLGPLDDSFQ